MGAADHDIRLKKLNYRSWHRGCKETDLMFGPFADSQIASLAPADLDIYEKLLEELDADLWHWLSGNIETAPEEYQPILKMIREHAESLQRA